MADNKNSNIDGTQAEQHASADSTLEPFEANTLIPPTNEATADSQAVTDSQRIVSSSDGYVLVRKLGEGQFGRVWLAKAPGGVDVAVKTISFPMGHRTSQMELRALEAMKGLRHSYLVQVQAYWVADDHLIALELADSTLEQRLAECGSEGTTGIPVSELLQYFREAAEAIDYLHEHNIMHRDIKPANIMLLGGHVKVADFGLARITKRDDISVTSTSLGTPLYMAPEVWHGKAGNRSDQYSLAITYAELRLGRPPFFSKSFAEVMNDHVRGTADLGNLSLAEKKVIAKALAKDPEQRYASCSEFVQELARALDPEKTPRRRKPLFALLVVGFLSMALAGILFALAPWRSFEMTTTPLWKVQAGKPASFTISFRNRKEAENPRLSFSGHPDGVKFEPLSDGISTQVNVQVDLNTQPGEFPVHVVSANPERLLTFTLDVSLADFFMPEGCEAEAKSALVSNSRGALYERIVWISPEERRVPFVLIDKSPERDFYVMVNKVTNDLYGEFAEASPSDTSNKWKAGPATGLERELPAAENPTLPVFHVSVHEAHLCARWMGGLLPSARQWDASAGLHLADWQGLGPFRGVWTKKDPLDIAVGRIDQGPLPAGAATDDVSPYGVHDMAGNGFEWTRSINLSSRSVPLPPEEVADNPSVELRGRTFGAAEPLFYDHLKDDNELSAETYKFESGDISFRVVIELP